MKTKIAIAIIAVIVLAAIGWGVTQAVQLLDTKRQLNRMQKEREKSIKDEREKSEALVKAYSDTMREERVYISVLKALANDRQKRIDQLNKERNEIKLPNTIDGRIDELNRISEQLGIDP